MQQQISYIATPTAINIMFGDVFKTVKITSDLHRNEIIRALEYAREFPLEEAITYLDVFLNPGKRIELNTDGRFEIDKELRCMYLKGTERPISNYLANKILEFIDEKLPIEALIEFWKNCLDNPEYRAIEELYEFLEHNGHPITNDGCFLAYKKVNEVKGNEEFQEKYQGAYLMNTGQLRLGNGQFGTSEQKEEFLNGVKENTLVDNYTKKISNNIGNIVTIAREKVDKNREQTCSTGLHVASYNYAKGYSGDVMIMVKVNPRDVVAVPTDYNNEKMRVCQYEVMGFVNEELSNKYQEA